VDGTGAPADGANKHLAGGSTRSREKPETALQGAGEETYEPIVPMKAGNAGADPGDPLEGRGEQTNVSDGGNMMIHSDRENMSTKYTRIAELARKDRGAKFTSIAHLLTEVALYEAFVSLRKDASAGVDGVTYAEYEVDAWGNIRKIHDRQRSGQYRAQPLRRVYIPKEDGRQRPISIPSLEDKIVQKATVDLLNANYEQDFPTAAQGLLLLGKLPRHNRPNYLLVTAGCHRGILGVVPRHAVQR